MIKDGDFPNITINQSVIMICIGTGIAPLRNLLWERYSEVTNFDVNDSSEIGKNLLFYGCRSKDTDYLYEHELTQFANDKKFNLQIITAFSREQTHKVYVQHKIKEYAKLCAEYIFNLKSFIIIVGSSKFLPKAIDKALIEIFIEQKGMSNDESIQLLSAMKRNKIYYIETW